MPTSDSLLSDGLRSGSGQLCSGWCQLHSRTQLSNAYARADQSQITNLSDIALADVIYVKMRIDKGLELV
jgi:hypothetical protein